MKILVSDFDETFFSEYEETLLNVDAVRQFINLGNIFIIATGRNLKNVLTEIKNFNIPFSYLICNDGGKIYNNKLDCFRSIYIPKDLNDAIYNMLNNKEYVSEAFFDSGSSFTTNGDIEAIGIIGRYLNKGTALSLLNKIENRFSDIHGYLSDNWINITNKSVNKTDGINYLKDKFGFLASDIYTIGNGINDINMIEEFNGYLINKAKEDVIDKGYHRIASVNELIYKLLKEE